MGWVKKILYGWRQNQVKQILQNWLYYVAIVTLYTILVVCYIILAYIKYIIFYTKMILQLNIVLWFILPNIQHCNIMW